MQKVIDGYLSNKKETKLLVFIEEEKFFDSNLVNYLRIYSFLKGYRFTVFYLKKEENIWSKLRLEQCGLIL